MKNTLKEGKIKFCEKSWGMKKKSFSWMIRDFFMEAKYLCLFEGCESCGLEWLKGILGGGDSRWEDRQRDKEHS
jgi:hypothetical protein